ncbi:hypothetical protein Bca4012_047890 [Brassica carinata]|uniref:Transmembrane protein n=3 Tax=Brassica TaxID=3705 RepID=A0A0D3AJ29_BRAOL|nr:unnamed protein product [Brassica napus]VDD19302.1 unnamed protein product [Brassica oleracea]
MEENLHRVSRSPDVGTHNQNDSVAEDNRRRRHYNHHTHGDQVKCSGRSWAAAAIADCVALCCCPCAIINFLTLTFVKVPWIIGRRCLGGRRKKQNKRRLHKRQRRGKINSEDGFIITITVSLRRPWKMRNAVVVAAEMMMMITGLWWRGMEV